MIIAIILAIVGWVFAFILLVLLGSADNGGQVESLQAQLMAAQSSASDYIGRSNDRIYNLRRTNELQGDVISSFKKTLDQIANCNHGDKHYELWARTLAAVILGYVEGMEKANGRR